MARATTQILGGDMKTLILGLLALSLSPILANAEKIKIGTTGELPPFTFCGEVSEPAKCESQDQLKGLDIDMAKAVCAKIGAECEFVITPWKNIFDGLVNDDYQAIFSTTGFKPERLQWGRFTIAYIPTSESHGVYFILRKNKHSEYEFTNEGLKGVRVGVLDGSIQDSLLQDNFPLATPVRYEKFEDITAGALNGEVDMIFEGLNPLKEFLTQNPQFGPGNEEPIFPSYPGYENMNTSMIRAIISKDPKYEGLLERINKFTHLRIDATYPSIL